jgi:hypothetical protein
MTNKVMEQEQDDHLRFFLSAWPLVLILVRRPPVLTKITVRFPWYLWANAGKVSRIRLRPLLSTYFRINYRLIS